MAKFGIKKVKAKQIALGRVSPRVTGVRVSGTTNLEIVLNLHLKYTGDARLDFEMETAFGGSLPFYLGNVTFDGDVCIVIGPISESSPIIKGVKVVRNFAGK